MAIDWYLSFSCPLTLAPETIAGALAGFAGAPVTTSWGDIEGNPRDDYYRGVWIEGRRGDVSLAISLTQHLSMPSDPNPDTEITGVRFGTPALSFPQMTATWLGLREALTAIGCTDLTLERPAAAAIVARMEDAGETALAEKLCGEITAALVASAGPETFTYLTSARADLDVVLAAHPETMTRIFFEDCRFRVLPASLRRFAGLEYLQITEQEIDGDILRGWSLPRLVWLSLRGSSVARVRRDDVAGFPNLHELSLYRSRIRELDPDIIEACPGLSRVGIGDTPLARDADAVRALRARWPNVTWDV